ncbi:MAG: peroxiredoxin [Candidatus Cloacimonetes bacterium 4572_55]|nr:MAG: peroxiredoxin [Candidatus Cloacimonetes bacterium 4572_55]
MENKILNINDPAPDFRLPNQDKKEVVLPHFLGKWVALYFYPKDHTPGCSMEAVDFTAAVDELTQMNCVVIGVSPDSPERHRSFIEKKKLRLTFLSDPERHVLKKYGVWQRKKNFGREYFGTVRSTFLIDPAGKIAYIWRNVRVKGHVQAVKERLQSLREN